MDGRRDWCFFPVCAGSLVQIPMGWQEGGLPAVWAVVCGSQACARGGGLAHAVTPGTRTADVSTVRNSACTYSYLLTQWPVGVEMRWHNLKHISHSLAASRLLMLAWSSKQDLLSPCFPSTILDVSLYGALSSKWLCSLAPEHPFHSAF